MLGSEVFGDKYVRRVIWFFNFWNMGIWFFFQSIIKVSEATIQPRTSRTRFYASSKSLVRISGT